MNNDTDEALSDAASFAAAGPTTANAILLEEDFSSGYGRFTAGQYALHYPNILNRVGVVRLEHGYDDESSIRSDEISLGGKPYANLEVNFSFRGNSMEFFEEVCLDASFDGGSWNEVECYASGINFRNGYWYDDVTPPEIGVPDGADSVRVRFRCNANSVHDDILIDRVTVTGSM